MKKKIWFRIMLVCTIAGVVALSLGVVDCLKLITKGPMNYAEISIKEYKNGTMVDGEIKYVLDAPVKEVDANKGEESDARAYFYLVPIKPGEEGTTSEKKIFLLVESRNKNDHKILNKIMEETSNNEDTSSSLKITGKVVKLDKETEEILADWFISNQFFAENERDEISEYVVSNIIRLQNWDAIYTTTGIGFVLLVLGLVGIIIILKKRE